MNPYAPPATPPAPVAAGTDGCPKCGSGDVNAPKYTWWGGVLGPKMLNHRICKSCGFGFNGKTRKSNTAAIAIYTLVVFVIAISIAFALR